MEYYRKHGMLELGSGLYSLVNSISKPEYLKEIIMDDEKYDFIRSKFVDKLKGHTEILKEIKEKLPKVNNKMVHDKIDKMLKDAT